MTPSLWSHAQCPIRYLRIRNIFEIKSHDQVDDVIYQLNLPRGIRSLRYNFMPCQGVEKLEGTDIFRSKIGQ